MRGTLLRLALGHDDAVGLGDDFELTGLQELGETAPRRYRSRCMAPRTSPWAGNKRLLMS